MGGGIFWGARVPGSRKCAVSGKNGGLVAYDRVHDHIHLEGLHTASKGGTNDIANLEHRAEKKTKKGSENTKI